LGYRETTLDLQAEALGCQSAVTFVAGAALQYVRIYFIRCVGTRMPLFNDLLRTMAAGDDDA
jgi:hypothetical protein